MTYKIKTSYGQAACTAMARALRKTVRKKRSIRSRILGIAIILLGALVTIGGIGDGITANAIVTWAAMAVVAVTLIFEDSLNAYIARKRMLRGSDVVESEFDADGYTTTAPAAQSRWGYQNIVALADTGRYIVFVLGTLHAQVYDKEGFVEGEPGEFLDFLSQRTGLEIKRI